MIAIHGWTQKTDIDVISFIQSYQESNIQNVVCTDVTKDGLLQGTSIPLYQEILEKCHINLIASGGVASINDIMETKRIGCSGVIIGKAIYEGYITLQELSVLC